MLYAKPASGFNLIKSRIVDFRERGIRLNEQRLVEYNEVLHEISNNGHTLGTLRFEDDLSLRSYSTSRNTSSWYVEYVVLGDTIELLYLRYKELPNLNIMQ